MAGRGSLAGVLAHGNANEIVRDMAREVLPVVKHRPVLAGVNAPTPFACSIRFSTTSSVSASRACRIFRWSD
jgi:predicted TIM-barrel enzyme